MQKREPKRLTRYTEEELIILVYQIETGILEASTAISKIDDRDVYQALRTLSSRVKKTKKLPDEDDSWLSFFVFPRIEMAFEKIGRRNEAEVARAAKKIIKSIQIHRKSGHSPKAYLSFLPGFLSKMGVEVKEVPLSELV